MDKSIVAMGESVVAMDKSGVAMGESVVAMDKSGVAMDKSSVAMDKSIVAMDKSIVAMDKSIVAMGESVVAMGESVVAMGESSVAMDKSSVAMDKSSVAMDESSVAWKIFHLGVSWMRADVAIWESYPSCIPCCQSRRNLDERCVPRDVSWLMQWSHGMDHLTLLLCLCRPTACFAQEDPNHEQLQSDCTLAPAHVQRAQGP